MPMKLTRRQLLHSSLMLGMGVKLPGLLMAAATTPTPEPTPEPTAAPLPTAGSLELTGSIRPVHDPTIIKADNGRYYLYCTGHGIPVRQSDDLITWKLAFPAIVLANIPDWAKEAVPGQNDVWAPDISYYNGKYHMYYAVSTFGKNRSVIGLATNTTLDSKTEGYKWVDEGLVLESTAADNYNCIDPNLVLDADGVPWLSFGSFWSGIKMRKLDLATGKPSAEDDTLYSLAQRTVNYGAVEAPVIIRKTVSDGDYYYLFVSFDFCCRGKDSTYHVRVGRSEQITGPYLDRDGLDMMKGGGTQVTFPTDRWHGPGHNAILQDKDTGIDYIAYHAYDTENLDTPTLRIDVLTWGEDGFPYIESESVTPS